jgi:uncharacterized protein
MVLKTLVASGIGLASGGGAYHLYAAAPIGVTRVTVPVPGLPPPLDGLRVGLITDVHHSQWVSTEDVARAVSLVAAETPDLVVLGGDYVTWRDREYVGPSAEVLGTLSAPAGVFAVLGNHDDEREMPRALASHGIEVLRDARTRIEVRGETLELAGVEFWTRGGADIARLVRGAAGPVVLLAHDPRRWEDARALNIPLVLSGHTHGGQVVLPVLGAVAAKKFPVLAGVAQAPNSTLFVSRGVGTVYVPVRINCPPEVAILTLTPAGASA